MSVSNADICKYRSRYGRFLFKKYRCEMACEDAGSDTGWEATEAVCNTCDGPQLEEVHNCLYFKIGVGKPYSDSNKVIVKAYCTREIRDGKDYRNRIKDLSKCREGKCEHYTRRPPSQEFKSEGLIKPEKLQPSEKVIFQELNI